MKMCQMCGRHNTSSEYQINGKIMALCFFCFRKFLEEGKKPVRIKVDREEEEKRKEIGLKQKTDYFRKIDPVAGEWIKRYLSLTGIMRNQYCQIVDKCKRLSAMQISHIMKEIHHFDVSPEMIGKYKKHLIETGELPSDKEFEERRPSEKELEEIRKKGARSQAIERRKEESKSHLKSEELKEILEHRKEGKIEELTQKDRIKELGEKQERGLCLTDSEERELEEYEENQEEDI